MLRSASCIVAASLFAVLAPGRDAWAAGGDVVVVEAVAPAPVQVVPVAAPPVAAVARGSTVLLGLALMGAGLVAGGAGFAVLYVCQTGTACYGDSTQVLGWVLAAPGIVPFVVGAVLVYAATQSNGRQTFLPPAHRNIANWGVTASPIPGGAYAGVTVSF